MSYDPAQHYKVECADNGFLLCWYDKVTPHREIYSNFGELSYRLAELLGVHASGDLPAGYAGASADSD